MSAEKPVTTPEPGSWGHKNRAVMPANDRRDELRSALGKVENLRRALRQAESDLVQARKRYEEAAREEIKATEAWLQDERERAEVRAKEAAALVALEPGGAP